jgi:hypothetical protein
VHLSGWTQLRHSRESPLLLGLALLTVLCAVLVIAWSAVWPPTLFVVPLVLGSVLLGPRWLPWFVVGVLAALVVTIPAQDLGARVVVGDMLVFGLGLIVLLTSFRRSSLGVAGAQGESMLVDLRDRIQSQGMLPALPVGWYAESALRSAGGTPFAGDFVVAARPGFGQRLELCVVDVSGKGEEAATRSLLLSGAFSGLIGALPPEQFLPAANDYLLRQGWEESFATAVHLTLDLATGDFDVRAAGHPPPVQLCAGSGRWQLHEAEGPMLGIIEDAEFTVVHGTLRRGDAVLLYTDGMVETRSRDISLGIDKLQGAGERLLREGFEHGARRLIEQLGSTNDDRALLLVHRR